MHRAIRPPIRRRANEDRIRAHCRDVLRVRARAVCAHGACRAHRRTGSAATARSAAHPVTAAWRESARCQRRECAQLRRSEGDVFGTARSAGAEKRPAREVSENVVGSETFADRRGFRSRSLWTRARERSRREVGSHLDHTGESRRISGHHETTDRARG